LEETGNRKAMLPRGLPGAASKVMDLNIDTLLDDLAERIAAKLRAGSASKDRPRLFSLEDAATYIGRTKPGLDHLIAAGKIPTVRADRRVMIDVRDLDKWIDDNKTV
jgi:hypothetical protein